MPLARTYNPQAGGIQSTLHDAYRDRLSRWSDIQEHLPALYSHACGAKRILELGSRKGNSTLAFLAGAQVCGGHVWSVDVDNIAADPQGMGPWARCPIWTFTCGDDVHPAVLAAQPEQVDLLFVDTSHTYDHTLAELAAYLPRVAAGGVALFHDTRLHLTVAGAEIAAGDVPPVQRALDDYCAAHGLAWDELGGGYGMGMIRR